MVWVARALPERCLSVVRDDEEDGQHEHINPIPSGRQVCVCEIERGTRGAEPRWDSGQPTLTGLNLPFDCRRRRRCRPPSNRLATKGPLDWFSGRAQSDRYCSWTCWCCCCCRCSLLVSVLFVSPATAGHSQRQPPAPTRSLLDEQDWCASIGGHYHWQRGTTMILITLMRRPRAPTTISKVQVRHNIVEKEEV